MSALLDRLTTKFSTTRLLALLLAPGMLGLGVDAAISHFAAKPMADGSQLVPVLYAPVAFVLRLAAALPRLSEKALRMCLRLVGVTAALIGFAGVGYHARAFVEQLAGEPVTLELREQSLAVAPPLFAPAAFVAVGALICALASPRVKIELRSASKASAPAAATEPTLADAPPRAA